MLAQGVLPFQYQSEERATGMTALAGLPVRLDLFAAMGLKQSIERHVRVRQGEQGWTDAQVVGALMLLNPAGGERVDDLALLEEDQGFAQLLRAVESRRLSRRERRALKCRWRKERGRALPSPSAAFRYLEGFHCEAEEERREPGKAFIPAASDHLVGLRRVNRDAVRFVQSRAPSETTTLDADATLVESHKSEAL